MNDTVVARNPDVPALPADLVSAECKLVYLYLHHAGRATVDEMVDRLGMRKMALFGVLDTLAGKELVEGDGTTYAVAA